MDLGQRMARYEAIERHRKRPLIVYAGSSRENVRALIDSTAVREFIDQVDAITNADAVDILLHSMGGDALAAWKIMSILRERFKRVGVLVPSAAFSAATVLALGADEIVMHPHASLGPIDPQITVRLGDGSVRQFAYEDLSAFLRFLADEVGLTEQEHLTRTVTERLFHAVDPVVVGAAKRASDLSAEVGERMISLHSSDERKAHQIAQGLNKSFFAHGDAVSRSRARKLELPVADDNPQLEALIWEAYLAIEEHLELRDPFSPLTLFLDDQNAAAACKPIAPLILPPNTPPPAAEQAWNAVLSQQINKALTVVGPEVPYTIRAWVLESARAASEFLIEGVIVVTRQPQGQFVVMNQDTRKGWKSVQIAPGGAFARASTTP